MSFLFTSMTGACHLQRIITDLEMKAIAIVTQPFDKYTYVNIPNKEYDYGIDKFKRQIDNLVNMCADGDISREVFCSKKKKLEDQILNLEKLNDECRQNILELEHIGAKDRRIDSLSEFIKMTAFDTRAKIPETVIDIFVDQIVYDHGCFIWYLNPT